MNIQHKDVLKRWLEEPEFRAEYERLGPKYERIRRRTDRKTARKAKRIR